MSRKDKEPVTQMKRTRSGGGVQRTGILDRWNSGEKLRKGPHVCGEGEGNRRAKWECGKARRSKTPKLG